MISFLQKFDRWDENGDGELDAREISANKTLKGVNTKMLIEFYDTNKSRTISLPEAQAGYGRSDDAGQVLKARR